MAGPVSGWKSAKTDAPGSDAGHVRTAKNAALRTSCNVLIPKCPSVSQPCPTANMQNGNTKRPIHAGFGQVSHLSHLSQRILVGVGRKSPATGARVGGGQKEVCALNPGCKPTRQSAGRACGSSLGFERRGSFARATSAGIEKFRVFTFCLTEGVMNPSGPFVSSQTGS